MKYHIDFGEDKRLSFEVLDNPVAKAWAENLKTMLQGEQRVFRDSMPGIENQRFSYFNNLTYYYNKLKNLNLVEDLFDLKTNLNNFTHQDFVQLNSNVDTLYLKIVQHNIYYQKDKDTLFKVRRFTKRIKRYTEELLDCMYNPDESYARIQVQSTKYAETPISIEARKEYWVETARPKVVIRAVPNFDLRSLEVAAQRNNPHLFIEGVNDHAYYINVDHKICFYDQSLTTKQADQLMKQKRNKIIDFVANNKMDVIPGFLQHNNFVNPIVAHLISDEETLEDYHNAFNKDDIKVTITLEE
jgi:hypothetical protein